MLTTQPLKSAPAIGKFLFAALLATSSAHAASGTWLGIDGNWSDSGTWSGGTIADGIDSTANFTGVDIAATRTITLDANRILGNITFTDATTSSHDLTISGANILTLDVSTGAPIIDVTQSGRTLTISSELSGADGLQKNGAGTLALTGVNTYTGTTTISAGTLSLSGGNDRLASSGTVAFSGSSTLSIANNQTLSNVTVANGVTGTINGGGNLTLNGSSFVIGASAGSSTQTLNLSGLSTFSYNNSGGAFSVAARADGASGSVVLPGTSTITANTFGVGDYAVGSGAGPNTGTLTLGTITTINANTITLGNRVARGTIQYSSVTNPTLTLRGSDGTSAVGTMYIGYTVATGNAGTFASLVDLTTGVTGASTLDALVGTLTIGRWERNTTAAVNTSGELRMGGGTLTATTINLGRVSNTSNGGNTTGTLTISGGTVRVTTLTLGIQIGIAPVSGIFNLNSGANLYAQNISPGSGSATRTFNWNDGTIHNYDSSTDLTINNNLTTFALLGTGAHTFDIGSSRQGTVNQIMSGAGALTKAGAGTLTLTGANTYNGATIINAGTLTLNATGTIDNTSGVVLGGGTFDVTAKGGSGYNVANLSGNGSVSGTINITSTLSMGGGNNAATINFASLTLSSGTTAVFDVTGGSSAADLGDVSGTVDLASAILDLVQLGTYTVGNKFTLFAYDGVLSNTFLGLTDGATFTDAGGLWQIDYNDSSAGLNGGISLSNTYVTITAIPEPRVAMMGAAAILMLLQRRRRR